MKAKLTLMTAAAALTLGLGGIANAKDAPGATSDITIAAENQGSLSAPEKDAMGNKPSGTGGMSDDSAANVPGANAEGDASTQNQGSLSAPEKDKSKM